MNRLSLRTRAIKGTDPPGSGATADPVAVPEPRAPLPDHREPDPRLDQAPGARTDLVAARIEATYDAAIGRLHQGAPAWSYQAVALLSGHLAAMHRTVYPVASRHLGENRHLLKECRVQARETAWALRLLQIHLAGESSAAGRELDAVHAWLADCLDAYQSAERVLVAGVEERLAGQQREQLAGNYRAAFARAPTRPHPRGPHSGWPGRIAFRLHIFWDGFLDAVDSRPRVIRPE
jgi:hypothetical protein